MMIQEGGEEEVPTRLPTTTVMWADLFQLHLHYLLFSFNSVNCRSPRSHTDRQLVFQCHRIIAQERWRDQKGWGDNNAKKSWR